MLKTISSQTNLTLGLVLRLSSGMQRWMQRKTFIRNFGGRKLLLPLAKSGITNPIVKQWRVASHSPQWDGPILMLLFCCSSRRWSVLSHFNASVPANLTSVRSQLPNLTTRHFKHGLPWTRKTSKLLEGLKITTNRNCIILSSASHSIWKNALIIYEKTKPFVLICFLV